MSRLKVKRGNEAKVKDPSIGGVSLYILVYSTKYLGSTEYTQVCYQLMGIH